MKTKNKLIITAMALVAIVSMTLALFACEEEDPKCTCPPNTVHYDEPCDCSGGNCSDKCTVRYSVGNATFGTTPVPVYAGAGVTDEEAGAVITKINTAYLYVTDSNAQADIGKTKKIVIVAGTTNSAVKTGYILNIGKDCSIMSIGGFLGNTVSTEFAQVRSAQRCQSLIHVSHT